MRKILKYTDSLTILCLLPVYNLHVMRCQRTGTSLVVQWLRLCAPNAGGMGSIPGQGTRILYTSPRGQKKKREREMSKNRKTMFCTEKLRANLVEQFLYLNKDSKGSVRQLFVL